jgi:hypothetical protein
MTIHSFRQISCCALLVVASSTALVSSARAQNPTPPAATVPAKPADVASPEAIIATLYEVISGGAGQQRDWNRFRSLFVPGARLIPVAARPDGSAATRMLSPDEYATTVGPRLTEMGFFEREIGSTTESFGNIMHVFSAYDSRRTAADEKPFARGINSIQLLKDGSRWWIVSIYWDSERAGNPIPAKYLKK